MSLDWSSAFGILSGDLPPKQPFWYRPGILADVAQVKSSLSTPAQLAFFLAASSPHSGDWLQAMPISSCGLRLDDEAVRIGVGMRLGSTHCVPHKCHRGALVDAQGLHGFVCKKAPGRPARHHALNDLIARAMVSAGIPFHAPKSHLVLADQMGNGRMVFLWSPGRLESH